MNIKIPDSWIRDYIKTNATPKDIAKALSLHSFSVEKMEKWTDGDTIYEIEITPNRGDALSVIGIARELHAVLPKRGFKCTWLPSKAGSVDLSALKVKSKKPLRLSVAIKDKSLVPRFSAIVLDNIKIGPSPKLIKDRLEKVGIRPIDNVVDVTNYFMIDKGQPMHSFDYDKILGAKMVVRESRVGERITTLDGVERKLPTGVIVIEDGKGRLIDLCGIMGGANSEIDKNTKKILLFVQIYDPLRIRKASMALGHRTDAAMRFEKGIDPEGVVPSLYEAAKMIGKNAGGKASSKLIDIVNAPYKPQKVSLDYEKIRQIAGVEITDKEINKTLESLGFRKAGPAVAVPSWRHDDISITEDLAEEVIRLYGYHNLPNKLLTGEIPTQKEDSSFYWETVARNYLKYQGFFECYINSAGIEDNATASTQLKLANPLSEDSAYLKTSLLPQLTNILDKNKGYSDKIKLFELASVYLPQQKDLPQQPSRLGLVTKGVSYLELKGVVEGLLKEMGVDANTNVIPHPMRNPSRLDPRVRGDNKDEIRAVELDFETLVKHASRAKTYTPISKFNSICEDFTFIVPKGVIYNQIETTIKKTDKRIKLVSFKDYYQDSITLAIEFLDRKNQISSEDTGKIREKMLKALERTFKVKLKV
jgi:phenylalanyl-tRNA synthetase beta chain